MGLTAEQVKDVWEAGACQRKELCTLRSYIEGRQSIADLSGTRLDGRQKSSAITNWVRYVTDIHAGFMLSHPVNYLSASDQSLVAPIYSAYRQLGLAANDTRLFADAESFGFGIEVLSFNGETPKLVPTRPDQWTLVSDEAGEAVVAVHRAELLAGSYYRGELLAATRTVYTAYDAATISTFVEGDKGELVLVNDQPHPYGRLPLVIYRVQADGKTFFSKAFRAQCDGYDVTRGSMADDIKHTVDSYLRLKGFSNTAFSELLTPDENQITPLSRLKAQGIFPVPEGTDVDYISRTIDVEKFKYDLKVSRASIHLMGCVPDLDGTISDNDGTISNISSTAIRLMFQIMLQKCAEFGKEFERGLRDRVALLDVIGAATGVGTIGNEFEVRYDQNIPTSIDPLYQYASNLKGVIPQRDIIRLFANISDPDRALEELRAESETAASAIDTPDKADTSAT